jgi:hypothetical protein
MVWLGLLFPGRAFSDGMVVPSTAFPAHVEIPDQQALIHFTNGVERLVIETRFAGDGTNFAWVVPLPSQPVIEEASAGLFPTLQYLFQPHIRHDVTRYYLWAVGLGALGLVLTWAARQNQLSLVLLLLLILFFLSGMLLPALGTASSRAVASLPESPGSEVSVLDRQIVGVFDTAVIASHDAQALQSWLKENGFALGLNTAPVIESYVKDGWVFVAAKVGCDETGNRTRTPHPLSFTFRTDKAVYPMRLTGIGNGPLRVVLYVFGDSWASAGHFQTQRCARPTYPKPSDNWPYVRQSDVPAVAHPLLRKWVGGAPVVTKLSETLSPEDMREDVWLDWRPFQEKSSEIFSGQGALTYALNVATALVAAWLVLTWIASGRARNLPRFRARAYSALVLCLVVAGSVYLLLPKTEVRLVRMPFLRARSNARAAYGSVFNGNPKITEISARLSAAKGKGLTLENCDGRPLENMFLGGKMKEEDSPGNFTIRKAGEGFEFICYDALGGEHVMGTVP